MVQRRRGNPLGTELTAGGTPKAADVGPDGKPMWLANNQFQFSFIELTRCFLFLEMLNVKTDMRDVEGLQTEPAYPTVGFSVYRGRGNHIKLDGSKGALDKDGNPDVSKRRPLDKLFSVVPTKGDDCYLELGHLESTDDKGERIYYVVIPHTDVPNVEHKYALTLYTDYEHVHQDRPPAQLRPVRQPERHVPRAGHSRPHRGALEARARQGEAPRHWRRRHQRRLLLRRRACRHTGSERTKTDHGCADHGTPQGGLAGTRAQAAGRSRRERVRST